MNRLVERKNVLEVLGLKRMPKLEQFEDVRGFVTRRMIKKYKLRNEREINYGYCFIWAYLVWALSKTPVRFVTSDGHVVVEHEGKYYDSTTPGATTLDDADIHGDSTQVDVFGMAWYWARCGIYRAEFIKILEKTVATVYDYATDLGELDPNFEPDWISIEDIP